MIRPNISAIGLSAIIVFGTNFSALPANAQTSIAGNVPYSRLNPIVPLNYKTFESPPQLSLPWVRWNFIPAAASNERLVADLQDMVAAGIGGVEIGQGGEPTLAQWELILEEANKLGIKVGVKGKGTNDPQNGPLAAFSVDDDYVRKTINARQIVVRAGQTFNGPLPVANGTVVAVLAYRCAAAQCATVPVVALERASVVDLTGTLTDINKAGVSGGTTTENLAWTAPTGNSDWVVVTVRAVRYQATPETMSTEGTNRLIKAYEDYWSSKMKALLKQNGGDFFVDSHAVDPWAVPEELWSSNMVTEFKARYGYDLVPNLPVLFDQTNLNTGPNPAAKGTLDSPFNYTFDDGSGIRVRNDHNQLRSDLFTENRIKPFTTWLRGYNLALRLQPEDGPPTSIGDQILFAAAIDRPEHESLAAGDQIDVFRPIASANHMTGNTWYSTECCAALNLSYAQTYQDTVIRMSKEYIGGVTKLVYHLYPSQEGINQTWPGYHTFGKVSFSNAWGPTLPIWVDAKSYNEYFARVEQVLTQGTPKVDVAVYLQNYSWPQPWAEWRSGWGLDNHRFWKDLGLQEAGYTWDYLNPTLLQRSNAVVRGKRLAAEGPAYKAFIYDATQGPITNTARGRLDISAAKRILEIARSGLPVIFVGPLPTQVPGNAPRKDVELQAVIAQILEQKSVSQVTDQASVPAKLASLSVQPDAKPAKPSTLLSVHRSDVTSGTNYYFLYNQGLDQAAPSTSDVLGGTPSNMFEEPAACKTTGSARNPCEMNGAPVDQLVTLEGVGAPYTLDAWTGKISPIAQYTRQGSTVTVRVKLATDASTIVALTTKPEQFSAHAAVAVTDTTAESAAYIDGTLVVRAQIAGRYRTKLSNKTTVFSELGAAPEPMELTSATWHLDIQAWEPEQPYGTVGPAGAETKKTRSSLTVSGLKAWPDIPELKNVSGVGTYSTTFQLPATWDASYGALLSLGRVTDSFVLTLNGIEVKLDQISAMADISKYLKPGDNQILVRVATTLNNQLAVLDKDVADRGLTQNYGLIGPVVLTPFRQAVVWKLTR